MRFSILLLCLFAFCTPARAEGTLLIYAWQYPPRVTIDPTLVTVDLVGGTIAQSDITEDGGIILFTNEYGRACYRVTIHASNRVYYSANDSECFRIALPAVSSG
jgi:hypothetical protein